MTKALLIEIGVEELPAIPLLKIVKNIEKSWKDLLVEYRLESEFEFIYTPRRLVLRHTAIPTKQADNTTELVGPPLMAAVRDGVVTKAGEGFARKCGVSFEALGRIEKKGKECLYYKQEQAGSETVTLLEEMLTKWLGSMAFGKMMRWGSRTDEFIRPIRWLQVRMDNDSVDVELFGIKSDTKTYVHRMVNFDAVEVADVAEYENILAKGEVSLYPKNREAKILAEFDELEKEHSIVIERDLDLLAEIVAITENPKSLLGTFDELFIELPPEAIIASMKEHQRYFPVFEKDTLSNKFVVVSNAVPDNGDYSKVVAGNERVLKPRLADGLFFYRNDLKRGLLTDGLEKITFMDGLGTLTDKIDRESKIAAKLLDLYMEQVKTETGKNEAELKELMAETISLAKADLTSEMVYEFTELQGLMGYYYAKALGKDEVVYTAIKEQYFPLGEGAELPSSTFSAIVAMSIKLDTLIGLFSVGKIPSGSKDPFALRRAVNGIVRMVINYDLAFNLSEIVNVLNELYADYETVQLIEFILERIKKSLVANPSVIAAVLGSGELDVNEIAKKVSALNSIVSQESFKEQLSTFKRVANISKEVNLDADLKVDRALFSENIESTLYDDYTGTMAQSYASYEEQLTAMFALKSKLDTYFDDVMVNAEDEAVKTNRKNTVASIYKSFKEIADIQEITI
ncbi:MAG: Glycyl-tRNA synthetase beta chain (EC [uncultured Sulfurovum sp.]|uniref:Glycine--tRNA ligase beta subunit n=1 Tax=uncultured Sulfurovum sp. TaxID=269237 RepID=A0A6S6TGC7_9BACT|nr:MAG: Glycyl-tRNA synthetase beta chain (EC [uncultured Sulfurovum sp.]